MPGQLASRRALAYDSSRAAGCQRLFSVFARFFYPRRFQSISCGLRLLEPLYLDTSLWGKMQNRQKLINRHSKARWQGYLCGKPCRSFALPYILAGPFPAAALSCLPVYNSNLSLFVALCRTIFQSWALIPLAPDVHFRYNLPWNRLNLPGFSQAHGTPDTARIASLLSGILPLSGIQCHASRTSLIRSLFR